MNVSKNTTCRTFFLQTTSLICTPKSPRVTLIPIKNNAVATRTPKTFVLSLPLPLGNNGDYCLSFL